MPLYILFPPLPGELSCELFRVMICLKSFITCQMSAPLTGDNKALLKMCEPRGTKSSVNGSWLRGADVVISLWRSMTPRSPHLHSPHSPLWRAAFDWHLNSRITLHTVWMASDEREHRGSSAPIRKCQGKAVYLWRISFTKAVYNALKHKKKLRTET